MMSSDENDLTSQQPTQPDPPQQEKRSISRFLRWIRNLFARLFSFILHLDNWIKVVAIVGSFVLILEVVILYFQYNLSEKTTNILSQQSRVNLIVKQQEYIKDIKTRLDTEMAFIRKDTTGRITYIGDKSMSGQLLINKIIWLSHELEPLYIKSESSYDWPPIDSVSYERSELFLLMLNYPFRTYDKKRIYMNAQFRHLDLSGVNFVGKSINYAGIDNSSLSRINLFRMKINDVSIDASNLNGLMANSINLHYVSIFNSNLIDAKFRDGEISNLTLIDDSLRGISFRSSNISNSKIISSNMKYASFDEANLFDVYIYDCDLSSSSFKKSDFRFITHHTTSPFHQCNLTGIDLDSVKVRNINWFTDFDKLDKSLIPIGLSALKDSFEISQNQGSDEKGNFHYILKR